MQHVVRLVGVLVVSLALSACGASPWLRAIEGVAKVQEESVSEQQKASDERVKLSYLACTSYSALYATKAQAVLDKRAAAARGESGADKALSQAEDAATAIQPLYESYCALAKKAAAVLAPATPPPATPAVAAPPSAPAPPPPTGGTPAIPATSPPVASPGVSPVGGSSPAPGVVP